MPTEWNWFKYDARNIRGISKQFKGPKLKTFPSIGAFQHFWYQTVRRYRWVSFLDLLDYTKESALAELESSFDYKPYPYKHYESVFTRFYQGYILPRKFNVDKRRVHLSALVVTNQMTREEALKLLQQIPYPSKSEEAADLDYFLKKMNWTADMLNDYIQRPARPHSIYPSERPAWTSFINTYSKVRKLIGMKS